MGNAATQLARQGGAALLALALAVPPALAQQAEAAAQPDSAEQPAHWPLPALHLGGVLAYDLRKEWMQDQRRSQSGVNATLNLATSTWLWEPWFAQLDGALGVTMNREHNDGQDTGMARSSSNSSAIVTGSLRLSVLAHSAYPFELHLDRNNSRVGSDLSLGNAYASERIGFTQHYIRAGGDTMIGWERNTQHTSSGGRDRQDSWQVGATESLGAQRIQFAGDGSANTHEASGEIAVQRNFSLQHSYAPDTGLALESSANLSRSGYHLSQGDSSTAVLQLASQASWRPEGRDFALTGGARLFGLDTDTRAPGSADGAGAARLRNANANLGASYDFSQALRFNASANVNRQDNGVRKDTTAGEALGLNYQPASIALGAFRYGWNTGALVSNRSGGLDAGRQLTGQASHYLARSFVLAGGSALTVDASQNFNAVAGFGGRNAAASSIRQLTHSASVAWDVTRAAGVSGVARLSASDTRALGRQDEFFQMVNLQLSSNLATGSYSSWSGNLTLQAIRQSVFVPGDPGDPLGPRAHAALGRNTMATSSGSLSYQNNRLFGVARLRFGSDLRLNSQALLPLLGRDQDRQTAAWENRLDYAIGRTRLRVSLMISRSAAPGAGSANGDGANGTQQKTNRALLFYAARAFGN